MTQQKSPAARLNPQDKAERTASAAARIMAEERKASDSKVARLKALRLAQDGAASVDGGAAAPGVETTAPAAARKRKPATRSFALQPESPPRRRG